MKLTTNQMLNSDFLLYQGTTRLFNEYIYQLNDITCIKLVIAGNDECCLEFHILNDEFENCVRLIGIDREEVENICRSIFRDINVSINILNAYRNDMMKQSSINQITKNYIYKFVDLFTESIKKYEVTTFTVDNLNNPEPDLSFIVIGNYKSESKYNIQNRSLKYALKKLFDGKDKFTIKILIERYKAAFEQFCIPTYNNVTYYH